jgi:hypothetical protein
MDNVSTAVPEPSVGGMLLAAAILLGARAPQNTNRTQLSAAKRS